MLAARATLVTFPAGNQRVYRHSLAGMEVLHLGAGFHDGGAKLVAQDEGEGRGLRSNSALRVIVNVGSSIFFQNANNSVRVSDEFMRAYDADGDFTTYTVKGHQPVKEYKAREIMGKIAESTWLCGDPGMQFDDTINKWHTSKNTARINASNPCSEYMFLDNSACNLASLNLMRFVTPAGTFDIAAYRHAISVLITAMEILVDNSGYPTEAIARNSHDYRPLGLGYANLGALLMSFGLPYDSEAGRDLAASMTAIMTGQAYLPSAIIAAQCPPLTSATPLTASVEHQGGACSILSRDEAASINE